MSLGELKITFLIVIILLVCFLTTLTGCRTLEKVTQEVSAMQKDFVQSLDKVGEEIVAEISSKIKAEIKRTREKLPDKIRREIERTAACIGLNIHLKKPFTKKEKARIKTYVTEALNTPQGLEIIGGNTPVLSKEAELWIDAMEANYNRPIGYKWIPSKELEAKFFERSPRARTARRELQLVMMAVYEIKDILITEAHRSCKRQKELYEKGVTKLKNCVSMHNKKPSWAVDFVPMNGKKALWNNREDFGQTIGLAKAFYCILSKQYGWTAGFRSGADWKGTGIMQKKGFVDMPHIAIRDDIPNRCFI